MEDSIAYIPPMSDLQKEDLRTIQVFLAVSLIRGGNLNGTITVLNSAFCKTGKDSLRERWTSPLSPKGILQELRIFISGL